MNRDGQYEYRINSGVLSPSQIPKLQQKLDGLLPYSLPVTRRIEYHLSHPISPTARIFVAAAADVAVSTDGDGDGEKTDVHINGGDDAQSNQPLPSTQSSHHPDDDEHWLESWLLNTTTTTTISSSSPSSEASNNYRPWLAAHIDLLNSGQTQVWLFASWEAPSPYPSPSLSHRNDDTDTDTDTDHLTTGGESASRGDVSVHKSLMRELFTYIYTVLVPAMPQHPSDEWLQLKRTGKTLTSPYSRNKVLFGTVGEKLWHLFPQEARARTDPGYLKYVFSPEEKEDEANPTTATAADTETDNNENKTTSLLLPLPPGYKFGEMRPSDLQTVLDRSTIPRTLSTLRQYVSVGIFSSSSDDYNHTNPKPNALGPVAWGFLGKDASISSLHTEPAHRGKGLAVCLARELLRRQRQRQNRAASPLPEDTSTLKRGTGMGCWAHADVSQDNIPSRRVMEKLGGKPMWMVMWTELDLEKVMSVE
jgi:ribosomal protein S18 acetylase RimI-like enzyme